MEKTLSALHTFLEAREIPDAYLIAPAAAMGSRILEAYAARYGGVLGLRAATPDSLALELCGARCPGLLGREEAALLVLSVWRERGAELPGFSGLAPTLAAAREILDCLRLLERGTGDLRSAAREGGKARLVGLGALLELYRREKETRGLWDRTDLFTQALKALEEAPLASPVLLCANVTGEGPVRAFLERLGGEILPVPLAEEVLPPPGAGDPGVPASLFLPQTRGTCRGELRFVRGYGAENEALFPFYDLLDRQIPFGEAAVLYAGTEAPALLRDQAARLGVPLTMAAGIPLERGSLAPMLGNLAAWQVGGWSVDGLAALLAEGLNPPQGGRLLGFLRKERAGDFGPERYFEALQRALDRGPESEERRRLEDWSRFFRVLRELFPEEETGPEEGLIRLRAFLEDFWAGPEGEREALLDAMEGARELVPGGSLLERLPLLLEAAGRTAWQASGPRPDAVHMAPLDQGAFLCRPHTYILGLDREALRAPGLESGLLWDQEREALGLPRSDGDRELPLYHLAAVLAAASGEITLSYAGYDAGRGLDGAPAPAYGRLLGDRRPAFFGYRRSAALTPGDLWLEGRGGGAAPGIPPVLETPAAELLRDFRFSASALELAMECPRRFYLQYLLAVPQEEKTDPESRVWLPPNALGSLVHETLEDCFGAVAASGGTLPDPEPLWQGRLEQYRRLWPCGSPELEERDADRARAMVWGALAYFAEEQGGNRPLAAELTFGKRHPEPQALPMPETFSLRLEGGREILFTGSVDRLDRLPGGGLCVLDYKTGSMSRFLGSLEHKLQYYLYARALEQILGERVRAAVYLFLTPGGARPLERDPGDPGCAARLRALLDLLYDGAGITLARPVWREGRPVCEPGDPERQEALRGCARLCPYARICKEV